MTVKKLITFLLCAVLTVSAFACTPNEEGGEKQTTVWAASGTEKVLQDYDYSSQYENKTLRISAVRNEYESAQIMLSGDEGVKYDLTLADLKSADGSTLSKESFSVYNQKYIYISKIKDAQAVTSVGWYPDALLPFEKAKEYGENVTGGKNQGIWVTLKTSKTQPAGVYTGNFTLTLDGRKVAVPVEVTVHDYTLTDEKHSKSSFMISAEEIAWGEFDSTVELMEKYTDFLLDFRLDPQNLPGNDMSGVTLTGDALESFLYYAEKYTRDIRCSHFNIPFAMTTASYKGATIKSVDFELFADTLRAMAERSVETGVNLAKKAGTYFIFFDEYDQNGTVDTANYNLNKGKEVCESVANELTTSLECEDADLKAEIISSIAGIKHKLVGKITELLEAPAQMVPTIDVYNTEEMRELYANFDYECYGENGELWTYTCVGPRIPYPTYHGEDILLSSRLYSWMMYEYGVVGNLYWDAALYAWREANFGDLQLYDYYDTALRYPGANLDGFLMYPGKPYGIYGPVASIRLHSIRDGNEDYEIMYDLQRIYETRGVTDAEFDKLLNILNKTLYTGTVVRNRDELVSEFALSRTALMNLIELATEQGVVVEKATVLEGKASFTLSAPSAVALTVNGTPLTATESGEINRYSYETNLDKDENLVAIKASKDGKSYSVTLDLGGKNIVVNGSALVGKVTMTTGSSSAVTVDEVESIQLAFTDGDRLSADITVESFNIDEKANTLAIKLYSLSGGEIISVLGKCVNGSTYTSVKSNYTLTAGWNTLSIPVTAFKCDLYGKLKTLRINLDGNTAQTITIGTITVEG